MRLLGSNSKQLQESGIKEIFDDISALYEYSDDFEGDFGGSIYLVETPEDLKQIHTVKLKKVYDATYSKWTAAHGTLNDTFDTFDACTWTTDKNYVMFFNATNNAGGNIYCIPKEIALDSPYILASIYLTNYSSDWTTDESNQSFES
jgi:hypothetical protein